jgi:predicted TIM-barrel fold metal-dependent hydrolase
MAKNGFKIFDTDTHVDLPVDVLEPYLTVADKELLAAYEPYKTIQARTGRVMYTRGAVPTRRRLGTATAVEEKPDTSPRVRMIRKETRAPSPLIDNDPAERIKDLDLEGVDVNLMLPSGWFGTFTLSEEVDLEQAMYRAYHRWVADYCSAFPDRLKAVIVVGCRDISGSLQELERCAQQDWPLAVFVLAPTEFPIDHPDLEPIWAACDRYNLAVALHTFSGKPPYAPGTWDNWGNDWLERSSAHPWCGQRNMAALLGSGVMDRYPNLRIGVLEAGHSWLPFWMARIDEQARAKAAALPPLRLKPGEYVRSGRYFQSIEMSEGERLTRSVIDLLGEDILMYASDYPHDESWFPKSVETVMAWDLPEQMKRKLFWDNAVRFYARYQCHE